MATPSTFGSQEKASVVEVDLGDLAHEPVGPGRAARPRRTRCRGSSSARGGAPRRRARRARRRRVWVGESAVTSSGWSASSSRSSAHERVVLGVGDLGRVERVVALVVVLDQLAAARRPRAAGSPRRPSGRDARADHGVRVARRRRGRPSGPAPPAAAARRSARPGPSSPVATAHGDRPAVGARPGPRPRAPVPRARSTQVSESGSELDPSRRRRRRRRRDEHPAAPPRRRPTT